jgi:hypothetical protein
MLVESASRLNSVGAKRSALEGRTDLSAKARSDGAKKVRSDEATGSKVGFERAKAQTATFERD